MVIDICVLLGGVRDLSKYIIELLIYKVILMMKKMLSVITY